MSELLVVLGDQLFAGLPGLPADQPVFMAEDMGLCTRTRHHQQKITLFLSAMRHFRDELRKVGREVHYHELDPMDLQNYQDRLQVHCRETGVTRLHMYEPADVFFAEELAGFEIPISFADNPAFLTNPQDWTDYVSQKKRLLMGDYYRRQRVRMGILLDADGGPLGGQWSFDEANRRPLPRRIIVPPPDFCEPDAVTREVIGLVEQTFPDHPGRAADFGYPVTHSTAAAWLERFIEERLSRFGDYEDALSTEHRVVFHSLLSPLMNCGLLTPMEVFRAVERADAPLNAKEGFIRQIIGWREFIRGIDRLYASTRPLELAAGGFFSATRQMKPCWYDGTTGLPPLDLVIRRAWNHGYAHHIERLMVVGAAMLMTEIQPEEALRWFMEMFIDSAEWVMRPNVYGMSLFADGGLFATKPYFSGSAYLLRMGDFAKGDWCEVWDGLYWRFIAMHRDFFASNPRMSVMVQGLEKLDPVRRDRIFASAEAFIARVTHD